jgi:hypothetical protein
VTLLFKYFKEISFNDCKPNHDFEEIFNGLFHVFILLFTVRKKLQKEGLLKVGYLD